MDTQLLRQVQTALKAQQDTIERQQQMLNQRDQDIAELTTSLNNLAQKKTEELTRLPTLYKQLKTVFIEQNKENQNYWKALGSYQSEQTRLATQLIELHNSQIHLVSAIKQSQSTLPHLKSLKSVTTQLEADMSVLSENLTTSQKEIMKSQEKISKSHQKYKMSQQEIMNELKKSQVASHPSKNT